MSQTHIPRHSSEYCCQINLLEIWRRMNWHQQLWLTAARLQTRACSRCDPSLDALVAIRAFAAERSRWNNRNTSDGTGQAGMSLRQIGLALEGRSSRKAKAESTVGSSRTWPSRVAFACDHRNRALSASAGNSAGFGAIAGSAEKNIFKTHRMLQNAQQQQGFMISILIS